jgi:hypothetical protein
MHGGIMGEGRVRAIVVAVSCVAACIAALPAIEACKICDDPTRDQTYEYTSCDGQTTLVHHAYRRCTDDPSSSECPGGTICYQASPTSNDAKCVTPCTTDASCTPAEYCQSLNRLDSKDGICVAYLAPGSACGSGGRCAPGFGCAPSLAPLTPPVDGGADADASSDAGADADAEAGASPLAVPTSICQDCSTADPSTQTCPAGASKVCVGKAVAQCVCGVPIPDHTTCPTACAESPTGTAFCALSNEPDPACGTALHYCDGDVLVSCYFGFVTDRTKCDADCKQRLCP